MCVKHVFSKQILHNLAFFSLWSQKDKSIMKRIKIEFLCTSFEKKLIKLKAKNAGLTTAKYCRKVCLEKETKSILTEEEIDLYKMLVKYHNNFKSIGNLIKNKHPNLYEKVYQTADEIKSHLKNFKK